MSELIDYLFIFWASLGTIVYLIGQIYERQQREQIKKQARRYSSRPDDVRFTHSNASDSRQYQQHQSNYPSSYDYQTYSTSPNIYNSDWARDNPTANQGHHYQQASNQIWNQSRAPNDLQAQYQFSNKEFETNASSQMYSQPQSQTHAQFNPLTSNGNNLKPDNLASALYQSTPQGASYQYERQQQKSSSDIPTATGFNSDCVEWVNNILYLFYTQEQKYGPIIAEGICRSLNEKLSNISHSSSEYSHLVIEFTGINYESSSKPEVTNLRTDIESDKSISATCKIYNKRISLDLSIQQLYNNTSSMMSSSAAQSTGGMQADFFGLNKSAYYELVLENLEGKLKSMAMLQDKLIVIQFAEKPDTKIILRPIGNDNYPTFDLGQQQHPAYMLISEDALVQIVLQALNQVVVDLYFGDDAEFPQFVGHSLRQSQGKVKNKLSSILRIGSGAGDLKRQIKQDFFNSLLSQHVGYTSQSEQQQLNRRVFIKILRAKNINYNQNVTCLIELDSPQQQALSTTKAGNSNPNWEEHFLFQLNEQTSLLTIELWDSLNQVNRAELDTKSTPKKGQSLERQMKKCKSELTANAKFLGLARLPLTLDELRKNPVQKSNLPLQPIGSPSDLSNSVGGEIAVELLYLENLNQSPSPSPSPSSGLASGLKKSNSASSLGVASTAYVPGDVVSIDRKLTPSGYVITTTTITKQKAPSWAPGNRPQSPTTVQQSNLDGLVGADQQARAPTPAGLSLNSQTSGGDAHLEERTKESVGSPSVERGGRLSRSRSRSLLRAIKKRFSFSKQRSRSAGPSSQHDGNASERLSTGADNQDNDWVGSDSLRAGSVTPGSGRGHPDGFEDSSDMASQQMQNNRAKSVPTSRDLNELPTIVINKSRLSDTGSAFTFTHPKSQLVIEVLEPTLERENGGSGKQKGIMRYYAIGEDAPDKRKWSKRGVKLHLFNEHQFIACHIVGSSTCHLCGRLFSRRPGKQGYKCRNCHLLSHKQCHVKVDHNCPYAAGNTIQLEYIDADPPTNLVNEVRASTSRQRTASESYGQPGRVAGPQSKEKSMRHYMSKSISMEADDR